jgi:hypothetical protein
MEIPINYVAVVVAALATMAIGTLWYGPLFGKPWMRMTGLSKEGMKNMKMTVFGAMIGGLITSLLMSYVLAHVIVFGSEYTQTFGLMGGVTAAFWCWLGFAVPLSGAGYLWEGKPWKLWVLNAAYYLVSFLAMGAILGAWA